MHKEVGEQSNISTLCEGTCSPAGQTCLWPLSKTQVDAEGCVSPLAAPFAFSASIQNPAVWSQLSRFGSPKAGHYGMRCYKWAGSVMDVLLSQDQGSGTPTLPLKQRNSHPRQSSNFHHSIFLHARSSPATERCRRTSAGLNMCSYQELPHLKAFKAFSLFFLL